MQRVTRYVVALGAVVAALALKYPFASLGADHPFLLLPAAVIVSTWYGGRGPGLFATAIAALAADILFLPPYGLGANAGELFALAVLVAEGVLIVEVTGALRTARARATEAAKAADQARREAALALHMREELIDMWTRKIRGPLSELAVSVRNAREAVRDFDQARAVVSLDQASVDIALLDRTAEHWAERDEVADQTPI